MASADHGMRSPICTIFWIFAVCYVSNASESEHWALARAAQIFEKTEQWRGHKAVLSEIEKIALADLEDELGVQRLTLTGHTSEGGEAVFGLDKLPHNLVVSGAWIRLSGLSNEPLAYLMRLRVQNENGSSASCRASWRTVVDLEIMTSANIWETEQISCFLEDWSEMLPLNGKLSLSVEIEGKPWTLEDPTAAELEVFFTEGRPCDHPCSPVHTVVGLRNFIFPPDYKAYMCPVLRDVEARGADGGERARCVPNRTMSLTVVGPRGPDDDVVTIQDIPGMIIRSCACIIF